MSRFLAAFLFTIVIFLTSDCHAQRQRGWFARGDRVQHGARRSNTHRNDNFTEREYPRNYQTSKRFRWYDPRTSPDSDKWERYPKYIGGFHASHYYNIGVPPGDIGFRGNGIYWCRGNSN